MTDNSILDLEQQINLLADVAFAATDEVDLGSLPLVDRGHVGGRSRRRMMTLVAIAASVMAILGFLSLRSGDEQGFDVASPTEIVLTDPLNIDLADAIALSDQRRLDSIGPQLTVDFDQLPEGWEAETILLAVDRGPFTPYDLAFRHHVEITVPDARPFAVRIQGPLNPGPEFVVPDLRPPGAEPIEIRGVQAMKTSDMVEWVEQGQIVVGVSVETLPGDNPRPSILEVAEALVFVEQDLPWRPDQRINQGAGLPLDVLDPLLAGQLGGAEWRIVVPKENAVLIVEPSFRDAGQLGFIEPDIEGHVEISINPFNGGVLVWGDAPIGVEQVRLRTERTQVVLPAVAFGEEGQLFAVPIDDRLDPIDLEFLDINGRVIGSFDLSDLVPHGGGATGTGAFVELPDGD